MPFGFGKKTPSRDDRIKASIEHLNNARKQFREQYIQDGLNIQHYQLLLQAKPWLKKGKLLGRLNNEVVMFDEMIRRRDARRVKDDVSLEVQEIRAEREEAATEKQIREKIETLSNLANRTIGLCNDKIMDSVARRVPFFSLNLAMDILKKN